MCCVCPCVVCVDVWACMCACVKACVHACVCEHTSITVTAKLVELQLHMTVVL